MDRRTGGCPLGDGTRTDWSLSSLIFLIGSLPVIPITLLSANNAQASLFFLRSCAESLLNDGGLRLSENI